MIREPLSQVKHDKGFHHYSYLNAVIGGDIRGYFKNRKNEPFIKTITNPGRIY